MLFLLHLDHQHIVTMLKFSSLHPVLPMLLLTKKSMMLVVAVVGILRMKNVLWKSSLRRPWETANISKLETNSERVFNHKKYEEEFPWLYSRELDRSYHCKFCELFPSMIKKTGGKNMDKWINEPVYSLTDHPTRFLKTHEHSEKQSKIMKGTRINNPWMPYKRKQ